MEKAIFKKMGVLTLIGMICIPLLYNMFFLSSYWDPYGRLSKLPVAVINQDAGTDLQGTRLDIGTDFVKELKEEKSFNWFFVRDKAKALDDLEDGKVFMVIEIPENFSENAATLLDQHPQKMQLNYYTDPAKNYTASQIVTSAVTKMEVQIADAVRKQYSETIFENMKLLMNGVQEASNGSSKLEQGAQKLMNGTQTFNENMRKLANGVLSYNKGLESVEAGASKITAGLTTASANAAKLGTGANQTALGAKSVYSGVSKLEQGLGQLVSSGSTVTSGSQKVAAGAQQLQSGLLQSSQAVHELGSDLGSYTQGVAQASEALKAAVAVEGANTELKQQLNSLAETMNQLAQSGARFQEEVTAMGAAQQQLYEAARSLAAGGQQLSDGVKVYSNKVAEAHEGALQLADGTNALHSGALQVAAGNQQLSAGLQQLAQAGSVLSTGLGKLDTAGTDLEKGSRQLADATMSLQTGAVSLTSGINELHTALKQGADGTREINKSTQATYDMFAAPTELIAHTEHKVAKYGMAMAPYIISIGLFACSLMVVGGFNLKKPSIKPSSAMAWFFSKFSILLVISIAGSLLSSLFLMKGLGLDVQSLWRFNLYSIIVFITFLSLLFLFFVAFGIVGQYIGVILLLMQTAGSEGTFPLALTPEFFHKLNPFLPMTYAIRGYREVISVGTDYGYLWTQAGVLLGYTFGCVILLLLLFKYNIHKAQKTGSEPLPAPQI